MKVCIFGAGAIGGYIGAHLARVPGIEVSVVGRGPQLAAIQEHGLRIVGPDAAFNVNVRATGSAGRAWTTGLHFHHAEVAPGRGRAAGNNVADRGWDGGDPTDDWHPVLVFSWPARDLSRNRRLEALDPGNRQWDVLGPERALGCVFWVATEVEAPGVIRHDGAGASFPIGEPDDTVSPRLERLAGAMREAGMKAPVTTNIRGWLWIKMISSLCWNPVATLGHATLGAMHEHPDAVEIVRRMMIEAENIAAALGVSCLSGGRSGSRRPGSPVVTRCRCCRTWNAGDRWRSMPSQIPS